MSSKPVRFTKDFENLVSEITAFYQSIAGVEVADRFVNAIEDASRSISINPLLAPAYVPIAGYEELNSLSYRKFNLGAFSGFPFVIFYEIKEDEVLFQAICHHHQYHERLLVGACQ